MGKRPPLKTYTSPIKPLLNRLPSGLVRRKPRSFAEWRALRSWQKLPSWEIEPIGYLLRASREESGLTQRELANRLDCSQQAVAQAERWESNPTVEFMRRWADACGARVKIELAGAANGNPIATRQVRNPPRSSG